MMGKWTVLLLAGAVTLPTAAGRAEGADRTATAKELAKLEADWASAVESNDADRIGRFFTDDFLFVGAGGVLQDRKQHLDDFRSGRLRVCCSRGEWTGASRHDWRGVAGRSGAAMPCLDQVCDAERESPAKTPNVWRDTPPTPPPPLQQQTLKVESVKINDKDKAVHVYDGAAVVSTRVDVKGKLGDRDISGTYQFTDTWVKSGGRWLAAARQQTQVRMPPPKGGER